MRYYAKLLLVIGLWIQAGCAIAVSNAPLEVLAAYIEHNGNCPAQLIKWDRTYNQSARQGEISRGFYYRVLSYAEWGACGRRALLPIFAELQKAWTIFEMGLVSEAEIEAKEAELINLFFAALPDEKKGDRMVKAYESITSVKLFQLVPDRQYFNCTYFGDTPQCTN